MNAETKRPKGMMTDEELINVVRQLANNNFTRYWYNYNYPQEKPWLMAVAVLEDPWGRTPTQTRRIPELVERYGFKEEQFAAGPIYTIERVAKDNTAFAEHLEKTVRLPRAASG